MAARIKMNLSYERACRLIGSQTLDSVKETPYGTVIVSFGTSNDPRAVQISVEDGVVYIQRECSSNGVKNFFEIADAYTRAASFIRRAGFGGQ